MNRKVSFTNMHSAAFLVIIFAVAVWLMTQICNNIAFLAELKSGISHTSKLKLG